jgi:hypothetical protein
MSAAVPNMADVNESSSPLDWLKQSYVTLQSTVGSCFSRIIAPKDVPTVRQVEITKLALKIIKWTGLALSCVAAIGFAALECLPLLNPGAIVVFAVFGTAALVCLATYHILKKRIDHQLNNIEKEVYSALLANQGCLKEENGHGTLIRLLGFLRKFDVKGEKQLPSEWAKESTAHLFNALATYAPQLEELTVSGYDCAELNLEPLAAFTKLKHLDLMDCTGLDVDKLKSVAACPLEIFRCTGCDVSWKGEDIAELSLLTQWQNLKTLSLDNVNDLALKTGIAEMKKLEQLTITNSSNLTGSGFEAFADGQHACYLTDISLSGCSGWKSEGMTHLTHINSLHRVYFSDQSLDKSIDGNPDASGLNKAVLLTAFQKKFKFKQVDGSERKAVPSAFCTGSDPAKSWWANRASEV